MPLRRRRSPYQQLAEFEPNRAIRLRECGFSFRDILRKDTVHDCWEKLSWDDTAVRSSRAVNYFALLDETHKRHYNKEHYVTLTDPNKPNKVYNLS
ncbi:hypothetical protein TNCV_342691 [Trichonephila clavipes]|nr:hypothetical protein TNCV_342691 [Trichonephila clavipes]